MPKSIYPLQLQPGYQRDGTVFSSKGYIDGKWNRFYRGLPQKMGGYAKITSETDIPRGLIVIPNSPNFNLYIGDQSNLYYYQIDNGGNLVGDKISRTPAVFATNPNYVWSFDLMFDTNTNSSTLIALPGQNINSIDQTANSPIYYGDTLAITPLLETGFETSGGVVVLSPYLFFFGNSGEVTWTEANDPTALMDTARVTGSKIVAGMASRGGNSSPAGLLWSLDSVIRVTQVGTNDIEFSFDTVTSESSILSSRSIVEWDGQYYWAGVDRFLVYNGIVQELPNSKNLRYFFGNLNYSQRQKVWATKVTQWGEIWWFFPALDSIECNYAVIYNIREKEWYDTPIDRGCGYFNQIFTRPIWASNTQNDDNEYDIWQHEYRYDEFDGVNYNAIDSYFTTQPLAWVGDGPNGQNNNMDKQVSLERIEPDFIQKEKMTLVVSGKQYANSPTNVDSAPYSFFPTYDDIPPNTPAEDRNVEKIDCREQRREMTLTFRSNEVGGHYLMGKPLMVAETGDVRP